jgi:hypothetical protein
MGVILILALWCTDGSAQSIDESTGVREGHCSVLAGGTDNQTFACKVWDHDPEKFSNARQIEIYRGKKRITTIETASPILEWHLWEGGTQVSIHVAALDGQGTITLYDTTTGKQLDQVSDSLEPELFPQWAKDQAQLQDESVPQDDVFKAQANMWMGKVLRQIERIQPGMKRRDLTAILTGVDGFSTPLQQTYRSIVCSYFRVDIRFKAASAHQSDSEDIIEFISKPYLGFGM